MEKPSVLEVFLFGISIIFDILITFLGLNKFFQIKIPIKFCEFLRAHLFILMILAIIFLLIFIIETYVYFIKLAKTPGLNPRPRAYAGLGFICNCFKLPISLMSLIIILIIKSNGSPILYTIGTIIVFIMSFILIICIIALFKIIIQRIHGL